MDARLPEQVAAMAAARGLSPSVLVVEITEDVLVADRERACAVLAALREMGVRIAVDDFGKGYSSLSYLRELPIDELKLDGQMLRITASIWVEREGQKSIVIGQNGALVKQVGRAARLEMEREFGRKVFLRMWVKVRENWSDDARALATLGFEEG